MPTSDHLDEFTPGASAHASPRAANGVASFLLGSALLGTIGIFVHQAGADPLTATWFRCAFGLLGLTFWLAMRRQTRSLLLPRATCVWVLLASTLMVLAWGLFFAAIERLSTGVAVVLFHVQPLWVLVLGSLWLKESIGGLRMASVSVAMIGLVLATGILEHASLSGTPDVQASGYWMGVAACLVGAFCTACATLIARRLRGTPPGVLAWWQCALGASVLWMWPMRQGWPEWGMSWLWLTGLGLIHTGLAYTLMYAGVTRLSTGRIAVFQFVYPAVAIVVDWLYFDQHLGELQCVGVALMAAAIWFAEQGPSALRMRSRWADDAHDRPLLTRSASPRSDA
jgi:drug/metabolite transporter (DMT)-like permease